MRLRLVASAGLWVSHARSRLACVASVSVRFRSKERGTRVKDRAENGVSERAGRGPTFIFWLLFHFSLGQNRESRSSVFLCSKTKRKRLLRRLAVDLHRSKPLISLVPFNLHLHCFQGYQNSDSVKYYLQSFDIFYLQIPIHGEHYLHACCWCS